MGETARSVAEHAARSSYGRLLAILVSRTRDIARAEDALAGAFAAALSVWPDRGVPANPEAWLLTTARNDLSNRSRHDRLRAGAAADLVRQYEERAARVPPVPDERLNLMFVCAHPAIDAAARTPLMLQCVLGLDAARIGAAFLTAPATMGQRLVRAKARIREAGLRFDLPEPEHLRDRLEDVLQAIYAAFGTGWEAGAGQPAAVPFAAGQPGAGSADTVLGLPDEAIYLGRLLRDLMPDAPEAAGLLSLMLFVHARRGARRGPDGAFVPLAAQDPGRWDRAMVIEAEGLLIAAARFGRYGRFQCEAAIQSLHAQHAVTGRLNLDALETLYRLLVRHHPTVGAAVALASVLRRQGRPAEAMALLGALDGAVVAGYQPFWVLHAHCLRDTGEAEAARSSAAIAVRLTADAAVRTHLAAEFGLPGQA